ncbi:hypothetical protein AB0K80_04880 [Streptomyces sp. NPDC052682]|uniref:hypothetical protein n=1 Tax=Streptomyces sp. NPDC052682 TaxID=3154954 RepID=UPI00343202CC
MSDQNDQDMSHPLEQTTGERDVPPEEDSGRPENQETAHGGDAPEAGTPASEEAGEAP